MIEQARVRLGTDRVEFLVADLQRPLPIEGPVDAILSTATFHWIADHETLFASLAAVLRAGGQLAAQCGGAGNIVSIEAALRDMGADPGHKHFATPEATTALLEAAGFVAVECWLHEEPTPLAEEDLEPYLEAICLGDHVEHMADVERLAFVHDVARRLPASAIDYVRLNIRAQRRS
jgi:trans-aconitate 2-methyltransferase